MVLTQKQLQLKQRFLESRGYWTDDWHALLVINQDYFAAYLNMREASERKNRLSAKVQEFIHIAVAASCTHMYIPGVRAHTHAALAAGATIEEIIEVVGLTYLLGIHSVSNGSQILLEVMEELGIESDKKTSTNEWKQVEEEFIKHRGFFPESFRPILQLDPIYLEAYTEFSSLPAKTQVLEPKIREIITCAFDAATTHLYHRGTKIHMRNALKLGATPEEIMEMLEITSLIGIHGVLETAPILAGHLKSQKSATQNTAMRDVANGVTHVSANGNGNLSDFLDNETNGHI
ncbi:hypothetical protein CLAIMM_00114 [Cladophialophora immunda]|nr:hypothetical protein CLAIMM_00114 [Cladophialophora immunda]